MGAVVKGTGTVVDEIDGPTSAVGALAPLSAWGVLEECALRATTPSTAPPVRKTARTAAPHTFRTFDWSRRRGLLDTAALDSLVSCQPPPAFHCLWPDHSAPVQ